MIYIPATSSSPEVTFNPDTNVFIMEGESYPENSFEFYDPIFKWLRDFMPQLNHLEFQVKLKYMNSSSTKCMLDILDILVEAYDNKKDIKIIWFYEKDNYRSLDLAEEFKEDIDIPFDIVPFSTGE